MPPLGLSPDQSSVVWFAHNGSEDSPVLGVTEWKATRSYTRPIDPARMRFNRYETLDPAWVLYQVHVSVVETPAYVSVSMSGADSDPALMKRIGARLDAAMATGQYDALFQATDAGG